MINEGIVDHQAMAKELIKRHGKDVTMQHIDDMIDGADDAHKVDKSEVLHHLKKLKGVKEGDEYDEKWKEYKGKSFKKEQRMLNFNDYLKEAALSAKQKKIAAIAGDKDKIDADDFKKLRGENKDSDYKEEGFVSHAQRKAVWASKNEKGVKEEAELDEAKKCMDEDDMDESGLRMAAHAAHKAGKKEFEFQGKTYPVKVQKEGVLKPELEKGFPAPGVKTGASAPKGTTYMPKKDVKEEVEQIDELSKKTLGSYVNKAAKDSRIHGQIATDFENTADKARKQSKRDSFERLNRKYLEKAWKREDGIKKAVDKLTKEDVQLDEGKMKELSMDLTDMGHDEFHKKYGNPKSHYDATNFKKPVEPGKEMERAKELAQRGMRSLSKEEVERIEEKATQLDELSKKTLGSYVNRSANQAIIKSLANPKDDSDDMKTIAKREKGIRLATSKLAKEEVEQEVSPYLKATLKVMDEGKIDNLRDAQKLRRDTQSAFDKDFKPDTTHPHIQVVKGTQYGGENQKDDEGDEKPEAEKEKRGRGRPSGSKSGARLKGGGHEDGGIPVHNLNLPKSYK